MSQQPSPSSYGVTYGVTPSYGVTYGTTYGTTYGQMPAAAAPSPADAATTYGQVPDGASASPDQRLDQAIVDIDRGHLTDALLTLGQLGPELAVLCTSDPYAGPLVSERARQAWTRALDALDEAEQRDAAAPLSAMDRHEEYWLEARRSEGENSVRALHERGALGRSYHRCRHETEALTHLEPTVATMRTVLGDLHPETLLSRSWLGATYLALGQVELGEAQLRATRDCAIALYGLTHPRTAPMFLAHADAMRRLTHPEWPINLS